MNHLEKKSTDTISSSGQIAIKKQSPNIAVILAGGKGTRLGLVDRPKPMVLIFDKPLLQIQLEWLSKENIKIVYILLNHLSDVVIKEIGDGSRWGLQIHYVIEQSPLGTAGALAQLKSVLKSDFFVVYGDLLCDLDLKSLAEFHIHKNSDLTLVTHPNDHPYDSDLIETDEQAQVTAVLTKPHDPNLIYRNLVNAAVYLFSPQALQEIPTGVFQDLAKDIFPEFIHKFKVYSYKTCEYLKDMGTPDRLEKVKNDLSSGKLKKLSLKVPKPCVFWDRDGTLIEYQHHLTKQEQVHLRSAVVQTLKEFNQRGILNIVITNQPMIAKGLLSYQGLEDIHKYLETVLGQERVWLDEIYFCPHHPEVGFEGEVKELKIKCQCRKPATALLKKAVEFYNIDLNKSFFIGDTASDLMCAQNMKIPFLGFLGGQGSADDLAKADFLSKDLQEIKNWILKKMET